MAVVKIPAWPKGVAGNVWANKLADASLYAVESDLFNYDTGTAVGVFSIPEDSILWAVGVEVVTAFTGANAGTSIVIQDTSEDLATFGYNVLDATGFAEQLQLKRYAKTAGAGTPARAIQVDMNQGAASAGTFRVWVVLKPNRGSLRTDFV